MSFMGSAKRLVGQLLRKVRRPTPSLPDLPRFKPRGLTVQKGDSLTITDFSIALKDANDTERESFVIPMSVPEWADDYAAGATFYLRHPLKPVWLNVDRHRFQVGEDGKTLDIALRNSAPDTFAATYDIAEKVLDLIAAEAYGISALADPLREHSLWWRSDGRTTLKAVSTSRLAAEVSSRAIVKDPAGNVRPPTALPKPGWHPSHAYFRRSQLTDSLDESYRYLFLALEAVLSTVYPWQPQMSESQWLKSALKRAADGYGIDLGAFNAVPGGNVYKRFMKEQYNARRCALFHAKLDREPIVPGNVPTRADLAIATRRLGRLYVKLASEITGAGFAGGAMTHAAFEGMMKGMGASTLYVSPNETFDLQTASTAPAHLILQAGGQRGVHQLVGTWATADLESDTICRAGALIQQDGETVEGIMMEAQVDLHGVDELEVCLQVEFANSQHLREWFL